ncbi:hypothetical protein, partial [Pseudomonas aeruginosa]
MPQSQSQDACKLLSLLTFWPGSSSRKDLTKQIISLDDGGTWTDQGNVTAQNGDSTDILVAPSLSYVYS